MKRLIVVIALVCTFSGCTGMEMGGKLWVTRVDEKRESQATHNIPLKCYLWEDCTLPSGTDNNK